MLWCSGGKKKNGELAWEKSHVVSFVWPCPLLLSNGTLSLPALICRAVAGACSRAASPLQTLRQMTRCNAGGGRTQGCVRMCTHTHGLTLSFRRALGVSACPVALPEMTSPPTAANRPFQLLTLPGARVRATQEH